MMNIPEIPILAKTTNMNFCQLRQNKSRSIGARLSFAVMIAALFALSGSESIAQVWVNNNTTNSANSDLENVPTHHVGHKSMNGDSTADGNNTPLHPLFQGEDEGMPLKEIQPLHESITDSSFYGIPVGNEVLACGGCNSCSECERVRKRRGPDGRAHARKKRRNSIDWDNYCGKPDFLQGRGDKREERMLARQKRRNSGNWSRYCPDPPELADSNNHARLKDRSRLDEKLRIGKSRDERASRLSTRRCNGKCGGSCDGHSRACGGDQNYAQGWTSPIGHADAYADLDFMMKARTASDVSIDKPKESHAHVNWEVYRECDKYPVDPRKPCNDCVNPAQIRKTKIKAMGYRGRPHMDREPGACDCGKSKCKKCSLRKKKNMFNLHWPRPFSAKLDEKSPKRASARYSPCQKPKCRDKFDKLENFKIINYVRRDNGYCGDRWGRNKELYGCLGESRQAARVAGIGFRSPGTPVGPGNAFFQSETVSPVVTFEYPSPVTGGYPPIERTAVNFD